MNKSAFNYILLITILTLTSCASRNYEWVKINTNKIANAKTSNPYSENVKHVDVFVNARYISGDVVYVENSADYFASQNSTLAPKKSTVRTSRPFKVNNITATKKVSAKNAKAQPVHIQKNIDKTVEKVAIKSNVKKKSLEEQEAVMSKLNSGLVMPKKKQPAAEKSTLFEDASDIEKEVQKPVEKETLSSNFKAKENLSYDNGLEQLKDQDIELNNRELKDSSLEPLSDNQIKEEGAKRNSYMWVGLVLLIIGLIIGLIFGGLAYFISVVGIVFLIIGYLTKT